MTKKQKVPLTLTHYKEPLKKIEKGNGHGYYGALMASLDGQKIQCHVCGKLFSALSFHIKSKHGLNTNQYREKYDLARTTSLISEAKREQSKARTVKWLASLSPEQKREYRERAKERFLEWKKKNKPKKFKIRLETKNKRGTCPDQLLAKIREVRDKLGQTPSKREFIDETGGQRYLHLIYKTFGSWTKALKLLGMSPRVPELKGIKKERYEDDILLEYLVIFYQENGKVPTETDCRRGLVPDSSHYRQRFGSFVEAKRLAGIEDLSTLNN